jgi:RHS repeat-associated protein
MTETKHIFGPNGHVADIKGGTRYYYHSDHLGSLKQKTDDAGNTVWSSPAQYDPFGEFRSGGTQNEDGYFYTGKLRDYRTGLYYYGNRYYDPKQGRFLTKDIMIGSATNSQKWNPYIYVLNNPLRYTDPTGNDEWDEIPEGVHFSIAGGSGRIMSIGGVNVSGEGMFLTENGIKHTKIANTGTNSSQTITLSHSASSSGTSSYKPKHWTQYLEDPNQYIFESNTKQDMPEFIQSSSARETAYWHKELVEAAGATIKQLKQRKAQLEEKIAWEIFAVIACYFGATAADPVPGDELAPGILGATVGILTTVGEAKLVLKFCFAIGIGFGGYTYLEYTNVSNTLQQLEAMW